MLEGQEMVRGAFTAGASGYVYKSRIAPDLVEEIRAVSRDETFSSIAGVSGA